MQVTKAVIAVAGFGTRFLPATKSVPKELLPIVDKPIVQYLVEEAVQSGIRDIILVTRPGGQAIADHFASARELEIHLQEQGKKKYLEIVQAIAQMANIAVVSQGRHLPYGNGSPILAAKAFLDEGEPFIYMFGDDLVLSETPCVKQLIDTYQQGQPAGVIAFQEVPREEISRYAAAKLRGDTMEIVSLIEKAPAEEAASNLAQLGRFLLPWRIVELLEAMKVGKGDELYLTYANNQLCQESKVLAHKIEGTWYTTGDPLRFLRATVEYALRHPEIAEDFAEYLRSLNLSK
ncbi:MAG: NTP transferase domain-containing protein [Planctomycetaceae bacterium]|nr:NTP transferase domain-containing protein [Planctomycetaceae bacterium]